MATMVLVYTVGIASALFITYSVIGDDPTLTSAQSVEKINIASVISGLLNPLAFLLGITGLVCLVHGSRKSRKDKRTKRPN